jgi:hypothetical protein
VPATDTPSDGPLADFLSAPAGLIPLRLGLPRRVRRAWLGVSGSLVALIRTLVVMWVLVRTVLLAWLFSRVHFGVSKKEVE